MAISQRKELCQRGHRFEPDNAYYFRDGRRCCLTCRRQMYKKWIALHQEQYNEYQRTYVGRTRLAKRLGRLVSVSEFHAYQLNEVIKDSGRQYPEVFWNPDRQKEDQSSILSKWLKNRGRSRPLNSGTERKIVELQKLEEDFSILCDLMGTRPEEVRSRNKPQGLVTMRQIITAAMRRIHPEVSYPALGRLVERDHATVIHSCRVARPVLVEELVGRFEQVRSSRSAA